MYYVYSFIYIYTSRYSGALLYFKYIHTDNLGWSHQHSFIRQKHWAEGFVRDCLNWHSRLEGGWIFMQDLCLVNAVYRAL